jgi:hypothetical protein
MTKSNAKIAGTNLSPASKVVEKIPPGEIKFSDRYRFRVKVDRKGVDRCKAKLQQYFDDIAKGCTPDFPFEPLEVFRDGDGGLHIVSGWHRLTAAQEVDLEAIPCIVIEDHKEAVVAGMKSNRSHGVEVTDNDKALCIKKAVGELNWSNRMIADLIGCTDWEVRSVIEKNELRVGTQLVMGKDGKMRPAKMKRKEPKAQSEETPDGIPHGNPPPENSVVSSHLVKHIIGTLKTALELPEEGNQRAEALAKFVKSLQKDSFTACKYSREFVPLVMEEFRKNDD